MLARFALTCACFAVFALGCGGAKDTELFGSVSDGGGSSDGAASADGGQGSDASHPKDGGTTPSDPGVHCDTANCPVPAEVCCRREVGPGYSFSCEAQGACNGGGGATLAITCDDAHDCANGNVCCVIVDQQDIATDVVCRAPGECVQAGRTVVCDPAAPNPCPSGKTCQPSQQTLPGYTICR